MFSTIIKLVILDLLEKPLNKVRSFNSFGLSLNPINPIYSKRVEVETSQLNSNSRLS